MNEKKWKRDKRDYVNFLMCFSNIYGIIKLWVTSDFYKKKS